MFFGSKPKKIEISGKLDTSVRGPYGPIAMLFNLGPDLQRSVDKLFNHLINKENVETKLIACKGGNGKCDEITAMVTLEHEYPIVRCHRFHQEAKYISGELKLKMTYSSGLCYCGEDPWKIPIVEEFDFVANKIFPCPYDRLK